MNRVNWNLLWKDKVPNLGAQHKQALKLINFLIHYDNNISSLCDFGCGQGVLLNEIKKVYPNILIKGADNTDFSKRILNELNIEYINFDLENDYLEENIDIGIMSDVLEHFYEPRKVLDNLNNLKYLIIIVPNFSFFKERIDVIKGHVPFEMKPKRGGHVFWFNKTSLNEVIEKSSFKIIKTLNLYPKKLNYLPFLKRFDNLFATSFCLLLKNKNMF